MNTASWLDSVFDENSFICVFFCTSIYLCDQGMEKAPLNKWNIVPASGFYGFCDFYLPPGKVVKLFDYGFAFFLHQPLPLLWLALQHWPIFLAGTTNTSPAPHAQMNFAIAFTAPGIYCRKNDFLFPGFQIVMVLVTNLISMVLMSSFSADYNGLFYHPSCMGQQYISLEYIASINIS